MAAKGARACVPSLFTGNGGIMPRAHRAGTRRRNHHRRRHKCLSHPGAWSAGKQPFVVKVLVCSGAGPRSRPKQSREWGRRHGVVWGGGGEHKAKCSRKGQGRQVGDKQRQQQSTKGKGGEDPKSLSQSLSPLLTKLNSQTVPNTTEGMQGK